MWRGSFIEVHSSSEDRRQTVYGRHQQVSSIKPGEAADGRVERYKIRSMKSNGMKSELHKILGCSALKNETLAFRRRPNVYS
jgi:hypothetical protein